jgi:hypothetical protein
MARLKHPMKVLYQHCAMLCVAINLLVELRESISDPNDSTSTGNDVPLPFAFLYFRVKVQKNDPSILLDPSKPFKIRIVYGVPAIYFLLTAAVDS